VINLTFERTDIAGLSDRFGRRNRALEQSRRSVVISLGQEFEAKLRQAAPKKTGLFAAGIQARVTEDWGEMTGLQIESTGDHAVVGLGRGLRHLELWTLIREGTRPHEIPRGGAAAQLATGYPLSFYWENGPRGPGVYHYWRVWHPGTKPNNFVERVLSENRHRWDDALRAVGLAARDGQLTTVSWR